MCGPRVMYDDDAYQLLKRKSPDKDKYAGYSVYEGTKINPFKGGQNCTFWRIEIAVRYAQLNIVSIVTLSKSGRCALNCWLANQANSNQALPIIIPN